MYRTDWNAILECAVRMCRSDYTHTYRMCRSEARCLPLSESEEKRGGYVIPKYALCNGSKDES